MVVLQTVRVVLEVGYALETWCLGATQTKLDCWLSSQQPLKSIGKGSEGLRDSEAEKGHISSVGCVDVLEVRLALV